MRGKLEMGLVKPEEEMAFGGDLSAALPVLTWSG